MSGLRRLGDLPGIDALEMKAIMQRDFAEPEARAIDPALDEVSLKLFGITADQAGAIERPANWDAPEGRPIQDQVDLFEAAGWDVTDKKRRPLRILGHFNQQLWLAIRGVAGELPFNADAEKPEAWVASLAADAERFRKR